MEMTAVEIIWIRSLQIRRIRYTTIFPDGEAKPFQHLYGLNVYDAGVTITKEEFINHVAKSPGVGLHNTVKSGGLK